MIRYYIRETVQDQHLHYTSHQKNENTFRFFSLKTNIEFYSLKQIAHYYSWQFGPSNDYDNSKLKIRFFNRLWDKFSVSVYNIYWCKLVFRVSAHVMNDLKITSFFCLSVNILFSSKKHEYFAIQSLPCAGVAEFCASSIRQRVMATWLHLLIKCSNAIG